MTKKQTTREKNEMKFNLMSSDFGLGKKLKHTINISPRIPAGEHKEDWLDVKCFYPADSKQQAEFFITLNLKKGIGKISIKDINYADILTEAFCKTMRGGLSEKEYNGYLKWKKENPEEAEREKALEMIDRAKEVMRKGGVPEKEIAKVFNKKEL